MEPKSENLSKDDLFLLLESYKNSVEMNTVISQQLASILELLSACQTNGSVIEESLSKKIEEVKDLVEKIRDKVEKHDKESMKYFEKLMNRVNLLYVVLGSIVVSLIWMIYQLIEKYEIIHDIAQKLGVS